MLLNVKSWIKLSNSCESLAKRARLGKKIAKLAVINKVLKKRSGCLYEIAFSNSLRTRSFKEKRYSFVDLTHNPDFVKIAEAYGIKSERLKTKEDLKTKLKNLILSDEGVVIDCIVEKEENVFPMIPAGTSVSQMVGKKGVLESE